ncbi:hypothetical protein IB024_01585 [Brucella sp. 6810]|uniref:hypothetical protein n=1 Tax=Brucella sp. 6810 TaxID=2769351 RepID=UPI00165C5A75|nr:hypothetical protein [Brucella sp. 6810]QNQ62476.1 hypothetical protein IB024_01585 [Brucella sp. 6810]
MPSKELISLAANAMEEQRKELIALPLSRIYPQLAEAAVEAIRTALKDPSEVMRSAAENADWEADHDLTFADCWRAMFAASALGEKSE